MEHREQRKRREGISTIPSHPLWTCTPRVFDCDSGYSRGPLEYLSKMYPPTASSRLVLLIMFVVFGWMVEVPRASEILERGLRLRTGRFGRRMLKIAGALKKALRRKKRDGRFQCFIHVKFGISQLILHTGCDPKVSGMHINLFRTRKSNQ